MDQSKGNPFFVLFDARAVRVGLLVALMSIALIVGWTVLQQPSPCNWLIDVLDFSHKHRFWLYIGLFIWSFCLFLTVLPLGTATIMLAGLILGPLAGFVQFISLILASIVLFEIAREVDGRKLEDRLADYPNLSKLAGLASRRGLTFSIVSRLLPIVPSAVASLGAAYFSVKRRDFIVGTLLSGWVRPVCFGILGSLGRFAPICGIDPAFGNILV